MTTQLFTAAGGGLLLGVGAGVVLVTQMNTKLCQQQG